jgi:hypothetical protein
MRNQPGAEESRLTLSPTDFVRTTSWQDEYRRIYELFDRTIAHPRDASATR